MQQTVQRLECDFTKFDLDMTDMCRIPWFCVRPPRVLFFLCGYWQWERDILRQQAFYISGSNAFDPKRFYKKKYQNGSLTSIISPKKLAQKSHILTLYRASHSEDLRILDLQSISIGFHTVKMYHFWTNFFGEMIEVIEPFWYFIFIESFRIKSIRPGNVFSFNFQRDFRLNINSRKIKKKESNLSTQNQGN